MARSSRDDDRTVLHDLNNALGVILSTCDLLLAALPSDAPIRGDLSEIRAAAVRAAELARRIGR